MYHLRNQDYPLFLRNLTVDVTFEKGGKTAYKGTTFVGYIGLPTGMVPGGWSVSANARFDTYDAATAWLHTIQSAKEGGWIIGQLLRSVMQNTSDWQEAVKLMSNTRVIAPAYYITAGT